MAASTSRWTISKRPIPTSSSTPGTRPNKMMQSATPVAEQTVGHSLARPVYQLRNVSKSFGFGRIRALDPVDLDLREGSFSSVIGPSGCGKSTLLKIMAGVTPPSTGSVILDGKPVLGARREIGMMYQQATLFPWLTALDNVLLPIRIRDGRAAAEARRKEAQELLELVGLRGFDKVYPRQLSGGMAQRTSICRMLITEPQVLLLDEPFSALDELARDFMNIELQRICLSRNATAFLITHSIPEAVLLSDVVYIMSPRPGKFLEAVHVDLPRPRTLEMMTTPEFGEYVRYIRSRLDEGAVTA
ncbi:ABC transporter ATP-binding protein [Rhizobium sp. GN54]|uniref:ABC transporter ATP-binding protein n=1 Tax=Rhizobium sp. GN54 TaxID=2898150 RepID=UPI001E2DC282|nr:ABC transporter ATP-binding protein [Rhizobium sp. GN54]MCD2185030.1 ABC transporter ATP-binding protein [Rhizobium sp. GN54]